MEAIVESQVKNRKKRRRGGAAVETALVMLPTIMFIMGVFEYGRFLMVWNVVNNAAREGCRYALVNNTVSTIVADTQGIVTTRMGTLTGSFSTGTLTTTVTGTHAGASTTVTSLLPGDMVTVTISGKFKFMNVIPVVPMPSNYFITTSCTMVVEGGT